MVPSLLSIFVLLPTVYVVRVSTLVPAEAPLSRRSLLVRYPVTASGVATISSLLPTDPNAPPLLSVLLPPPSYAADGTSASASISISSVDSPDPRYITTVVLDSQSSSAGVELSDTKIVGTKSVVVAKSLASDGEAAKQGVQPGMILLKYPDSKAVRGRIKGGPYPIVLQFYNLAEGAAADISPEEALLVAQGQKSTPLPSESEFYGNRGAGLGIKTINKQGIRNCDNKSKRGDIMEVKYEARIGGRGGIVYDSSDESGNGIFKLGKGEVVQGVDLGTVGMCVGDAREIDIPSTLGYGAKGSQLYIIPPGSRLFWTVELVGLGSD